MERIGTDGFSRYRREIKRETKGHKPAAAGGFLGALLGAESAEAPAAAPEDVHADTKELVDQVIAAGTALKGHVDSSTLESYKEAVHRFLSAVVRRGLDVEERTSGANIFKRKRFAVLTEIDRKLSSLAAAVLSEQQGQLDILARIEEINGLIVNLVH